MSIRAYPVFLLFVLLTACNGPNQSKLKGERISQGAGEVLEDGKSNRTVPDGSERKSRENAIRSGDGNVVNRGFLDSKGNMWFTTTKEGIFRYDGTSFTNFTEADGLCSNDVSAIIEDKDGTLWLGTRMGLCSFNGKTFHHIPIPKNEVTSAWLEEGYPIINPNGILSLIQDREGVLWIGSNGRGAYRYDGKTFTSLLKNKGKLMPDSLYHNVITSILEDRKGNIWFSSFSHGGVSKYDGEKLSHFGTEDGLGDDMISTSFLDKSGNIWFGTRAGGMTHYDGKTFTTLVAPDGPCENNMASIYEDETGRLLIGSFARSGMCWYDGTSFIPFEVEGSGNLVDIKFISEDRDGNLWFGGRHGILWRYDGKTLTDFTQKGRA